MTISVLRPDLFSVHEATLETLCLRRYIRFQMFKDKQFFPLEPAIMDSHYYGH